MRTFNRLVSETCVSLSPPPFIPLPLLPLPPSPPSSFIPLSPLPPSFPSPHSSLSPLPPSFPSSSLSPLYPSFLPHSPLLPPLPSTPLSVGASPSPAHHSGSAPATIWLRNIIWNSHALEVDAAGAVSQHSQGAWRGSCKVVVLVLVAGAHLAAFRGNTWQIRDLSGKKLQQSRVCECSDCY